MPLLIIPIVIAVALGAWVMLLPVLMWQRYRMGRSRQRGVRWVVLINCAAMVVSLVLFLLSMAVTEWWWPGALMSAATGLGIGGVLGLLGLRFCHFENTPQGVFYTPNRWIILSLTLLVAARLSMSAFEVWRSWRTEGELAPAPLFDHATLFGVAGVVLGYSLVFAIGLQRRLAKW